MGGAWWECGTGDKLRRPPPLKPPKVPLAVFTVDSADLRKETSETDLFDTDLVVVVVSPPALVAEIEGETEEDSLLSFEHWEAGAVEEGELTF